MELSLQPYRPPTFGKHGSGGRNSSVKSDLRLIYKHSTDYGSFLFDSLEQMQKLNLVPPLTSSELMAIRREAEQNLAQIGAETY